MSEAVGLPEGSLAEILDPTVFAEERRGQPQRQAQLEREAVDPRWQQHRSLIYKHTQETRKQMQKINQNSNISLNSYFIF